MLKLVIDFLCVYVGAIGFGILVNVPRRAFHWDGMVAVIGYFIYIEYLRWTGSYIGANILGTLGIGIFSKIASKRKKLPVIIFNIPGLVPLVPGSQSYQVISDSLVGKDGLAGHYLLQVIFIAGAIAFGFLISALILQFFFKLKRSYLKF